MLSLEFTESAKKDLKGITRYTKRKFGKEQAVAYKVMLDKQFDFLRQNPRMGHQKSEVKEGILCVAARQHLIFYQLEDTTIYVLRILHSSMDYARQL